MAGIAPCMNIGGIHLLWHRAPVLSKEKLVRLLLLVIKKKTSVELYINFSVLQKSCLFSSGTTGQNRHCRPLSLGNHAIVFFWARKVTGCFPSAEDPSKFDNLVREKGTCFGLYLAKLFPKKKTPWIPQRQSTWTICTLNYLKSAYKRYILPGSLTWSLKINHPKRKVIFQPSFFRVYVKLRGCKTHRGQWWFFKLNCRLHHPRTPQTNRGALLMTEERTEVVNFCVSSQPG